jgi:hypothetical protein
MAPIVWGGTGPWPGVAAGTATAAVAAGVFWVWRRLGRPPDPEREAPI